MNLTGIGEMNREVEREALFLHGLLDEIRKVLVGQDALVERALVGLLADGHILLEGVRGSPRRCWLKRWPRPSTLGSPASSSPRTCSLQT